MGSVPELDKAAQLAERSFSSQSSSKGPANSTTWPLQLLNTTLLVLCVVLLVFSTLRTPSPSFHFAKMQLGATFGAFALLLFMAYQQRQIQRAQVLLKDREELFRLISENANDMVGLVGVNGQRIYNSPGYTKMLGYSPEELQSTSSFEQIHPDDRQKVIEAGKEARITGVGRRLEYRVKHKDGSWRVLESTASPIRNSRGEVEKLVIVNRDITERKLGDEKLARSASYDALTELPNRACFMEHLQRTFDFGKQTPGYNYAVLFIDVDDFKKINDTMGHVIGDQVIMEVGRRLTASLRRQDRGFHPAKQEFSEPPMMHNLVARLGGDEFAILSAGMNDPGDALRIAKRIQETLTLPLALNKQDFTISASVGVALSSVPHTTPEELLRDADIAMYRAKVLGKARCEVFDQEMHTRVVDRAKLEADLREAVKRQEFRLHFQPIICFKTERISGFEALLRWQRPGIGLVGPKEFIHVAEETGLILPIGRWLLQESCRQLKLWQVTYPCDPPLTISVNVSPKQFAQANLIYESSLALQESGLDSHSLHLEITESMAMSDSAKTSHVLSELKSLNIGISIDDFGTGYSSLDQLRRFPVDILKIDRSFVSGMDVDNESLEIVRLVAMLAHNLGMKVIAEGVENAQHVSNLKQLGCEFGQGYFFSKPLSREDARALLESTHRKTRTLAARV
ncbi:MAG: sensor-containing diguanylate cyclase/phosphodiesterase [Acidobacteriaceae bacterium]|nr:sensor-containing diguanylate cyclase/phosphodiesterase [Acidobacteriaceae bacterium]